MPAAKNPATAKKLGATLRPDQGNRLPARPAPAIVSYAELAREVGLTSSAVSYKIRRGMSVTEIRQEGARRALAREQGPLKGKGATAGVPRSLYQARKEALAPAPSSTVAHAHGRKVTPPDEDLFNAQTRKEIALANKQELEVKHRLAELVSISACQSWMTGCIIKAKDVWMGLRDLAERIQHEPDVVKAQQMVDVEVRRGLEELEKFSTLSAHAILRAEQKGKVA